MRSLTKLVKYETSVLLWSACAIMSYQSYAAAQEPTYLICSVKDKDEGVGDFEQVVVVAHPKSFEVDGHYYPVVSIRGSKITGEKTAEDWSGEHIDVVEIDRVTGDIVLSRYSLNYDPQADINYYVTRDGKDYYLRFEHVGTCQKKQKIF